MVFVGMFFFLGSGENLFAQIKLPKILSDHAILQRDTELRLYGWAEPHEKIKLAFKGENIETTVDSDGKWLINLPAQKAGRPYSMTFTSPTDTVEIKDILFGDVFLASGQSNMELSMARLADTYPQDIKESDNPEIRQFLVPDTYAFQQEKEDFSEGSWKAATPKNLLDFSGVAYFFARELNRDKKVPIGIVNSALGGSPIAAWLDEASLKDFPDLYKEYLQWRSQVRIDSTLQADQQKIGRWYATLDQIDNGLKEGWFRENHDKSDWETYTVPGMQSQPSEEAGVYWFSTKLNIDRLPESPTAKLFLGRLVDADQTYLNGEKIGGTEYQYPPRKYVFRSDLLREGANEIVVRLINNGGEFGFVEDKSYVLILDKDTLDLSGNWWFKRGADLPKTPSQTFIRWKPGGLYNAMIAPLKDFKLKGVLWYQGESDTGWPQRYESLLTQMITAWRNQFQNDELPFLIIQLPNFMKGSSGPQQSAWAELREAQRRTSLKIPHTELVVTIDLGEWNDIHPLNKKEVGYRAALKARELIYGEKITGSGPVAVDGKIENGAAILRFKNLAAGWWFKKGKGPTGFTVSEDGKGFYQAEAKVVSNNGLKIQSKEVKNLVWVRYGWADNPADANLYNRDSLPAVPFEMRFK